MFKKWFFRIKMSIYVIGVLALLIAIFENTGAVPVYFLSFEVNLPQSLWLLVSFLLGSLLVFTLFMIGWLPFGEKEVKEKPQKESTPVVKKEEEKKVISTTVQPSIHQDEKEKH